MKITIVDPSPGEEDEIVIRCRQLDERLIRMLREYGGDTRLRCLQDGKIYFIPHDEVFYFESVDDKVFVYCEKEVYEIKHKLYELEELLPFKDFMRASKSTIICMAKITSLAPAFGGRFEALLSNGERVIISRQYVPELKRRLGL